MSEPFSPEEAAEELGDQVVTASAEEWYEIVTNAFRKRDSAVRERCAQEMREFLVSYLFAYGGEGHGLSPSEREKIADRAARALRDPSVFQMYARRATVLEKIGESEERTSALKDGGAEG